MKLFSVLLPEYDGATVVVVAAADAAVMPGRITLRVVVGIVTIGAGKGAKVGDIVAKVCTKEGLGVVDVVVNSEIGVVNGGIVKDLKLGVVENKSGLMVR